MAAALVLSLPAFGQAPESAHHQVSVSSSPSQSICEQLAQLAVANTKITLAQTVAAGTFSGPPAAFSGQDLTPFYKGLPAFCRVVAEAHPTPDSNIKIEIWMPATGWNGRLQGIGNGGFAGLIDYQHLGQGISQGFAITGTDAGHTGSPVDATWAVGHPEKVVDFGHRGIHEMTRVAKAVAQGFYGNAPRRSYFSGCSDGGREALMEAQRYPEDYDGILAGAPAAFWTNLLTTAVWDSQALMLAEGSYIPAARAPAIAAAVNAACDGLDGVRDGILNDPRQCHFDPAVMLCKDGEASDKCLTAPQVTALKKLYAGPVTSNGQKVLAGFLPGAEDGPGGWATWILGPAPGGSLQFFFGRGYYSGMVYEKLDWDYKSFVLDRDLKLAQEKTAAALDAANPDLGPFKARSGKLILYHGWDDPAIPPESTVDYYDRVVGKMGGREVQSFVRLYMVPGMQHCGGGPGTDVFGENGNVLPADPAQNVHAALEQWVEKGVAPSTIIASKQAGGDAGQHTIMTRPLCPYPSYAKYKGSGDVNDARNFTCKKGKE